jgi:hypothetical protein
MNALLERKLANEKKNSDKKKLTMTKTTTTLTNVVTTPANLHALAELFTVLK